MKKLIPLLLLCVLLFSIGVLAESPAPIALPEFEFVDKIPKNNLYTALEIEGIDHPVFAYEHVDGYTAFRVYGQVGNKKGYYVADLTYENGAFELQVDTDGPRKDAGGSAAVPKSIARDKVVIPKDNNWYYNYEKNYIFYIDVFGTQYNYGLGNYRDGELEYIPLAKNNRFIAGSLPIDTESVKEYMKEKPYNFLKPREYAAGYQTKVFIYTSNAQRVSVPTALPVLDTANLEVDHKVKDYGRVRVGTSNADLAGIQRMLTDLGYYAGDIDGVFGEGMAKGIALFQENNGIKVSGKPDVNTLRLLYFGDPKKNPNPVKQEDFSGNGVSGETYKNNYLDGLGK